MECSRCDKKVWARGLCPYHYSLWRRTEGTKKCKLCDSPITGLGYCNRHYKQYKEGRLGQRTVYDPQPWIVKGVVAELAIKDTKVLIDADMLESVCKYKWCVDAKGYVRSTWGGKLHRLIMNAPAELQVDHINMVKGDNRRENLRLCTNEENMRFRREYNALKRAG